MNEPLHIVDATPRTRRGETLWRAACSCGWRGTDNPSRYRAELEGDEHTEEVPR